MALESFPQRSDREPFLWGSSVKRQIYDWLKVLGMLYLKQTVVLVQCWWTQSLGHIRGCSGSLNVLSQRYSRVLNSSGIAALGPHTTALMCSCLLFVV